MMEYEREVRPHHQPAQPLTRPPLDLALGLLTAACAALVVFGSIEFRTSRYWSDGMSGSSWTEGAARWAGRTFLSGVAALILLAIAGYVVADDRRRLSGAFAFIAAGPLLFAADRASSNWQRLLAEKEQPRDYVLTIAPGLPVVTVCVAVGAILALVLAIRLARSGR